MPFTSAPRGGSSITSDSRSMKSGTAAPAGIRLILKIRNLVSPPSSRTVLPPRMNSVMPKAPNISDDGRGSMRGLGCPGTTSVEVTTPDVSTL